MFKKNSLQPYYTLTFDRIHCAEREREREREKENTVMNDSILYDVQIEKTKCSDQLVR